MVNIICEVKVKLIIEDIHKQDSQICIESMWIKFVYFLKYHVLLVVLILYSLYSILCATKSQRHLNRLRIAASQIMNLVGWKKIEYHSIFNRVNMKIT